VSEEEAVNRPVAELLVPADAEAQGQAGFAAAIAEAARGAEDPASVFVRPWNTFGVRMRARIASCGPPRAALVVLGSPGHRRLRAVD
jgi:nucleotide-binding universal stress UspA family protein